MNTKVFNYKSHHGHKVVFYPDQNAGVMVMMTANDQEEETKTVISFNEWKHKIRSLKSQIQKNEELSQDPDVPADTRREFYYEMLDLRDNLLPKMIEAIELGSKFGDFYSPEVSAERAKTSPKSVQFSMTEGSRPNKTDPWAGDVRRYAGNSKGFQGVGDLKKLNPDQIFVRKD